jgi:soluble lytic murein transglycosylase
MTMRPCWDPTIRGRWSRLAPLLPVWLLLAATPALGASLESLGAAFLKNPTAANKASLLRYAASRGPSQEAALAQLVIGSVEAGGEGSRDAIPRLREARKRLTTLQDYTGYHLGRALYVTANYQEALEELGPAISASPVSPLRVPALMLSARIHLESGDPRRAIRLLRERAADLPEPGRLELLALSLEKSGDLAEAARTCQRIYYEFPASPEAQRAAPAIARLKQRLGSRYPSETPEMMFTRVDKLIAAREHELARRELQTMTTALGGAARDRARVGLGRARYLRGHDAIAHKWLSALRVSSPEAEAERLYYLLASSRRLGRTGEMLEALKQLNARHPQSPWRLEGLVAVGNHYLLSNDVARYEPVFKACADAFPSSPQAPYCHWKISWAAYLARRPAARLLLLEHLRRFPASEKADAALYFLGRLSQLSGDESSARAWFEEVLQEYPNRYYATLAETQLQSATVAAAKPSLEVRRFLEKLEFPHRSRTFDFQPNKNTQIRLGRARLLASAGLQAWAENELRFGARTDPQGALLAMELSRTAARSGEYGKSIRYIKGLVPGYLWMPFDSAPEEFWRLAYPLYYKEHLARYARMRDLDIYFLAALIRQESEFDAKAVSRAKAIGLTQVLPTTGRELSGKLGYRPFNASMLHRPDVNLNMGTYYLRLRLDHLEGHVEAALAAYNAGLSRARMWLNWAEYREPAEYIETIPFTETRNYVSIVLRNAEIYRRLYAAEKPSTAVAAFLNEAPPLEKP